MGWRSVVQQGVDFNGVPLRCTAGGGFQWGGTPLYNVGWQGSQLSGL